MTHPYQSGFPRETETTGCMAIDGRDTDNIWLSIESEILYKQLADVITEARSPEVHSRPAGHPGEAML